LSHADTSASLSTLAKALGLASSDDVFLSQAALLASLRKGEVPTSLDIPTRLGKTAVMAMWLVARSAGANLPRRSVYLVDRRAVVDQATDVALGLWASLNADPRHREAARAFTPTMATDPCAAQRVLRPQARVARGSHGSAMAVGTVDVEGSGYGESR